MTMLVEWNIRIIAEFAVKHIYGKHSIMVWSCYYWQLHTLQV